MMRGKGLFHFFNLLWKKKDFSVLSILIDDVVGLIKFR